MEANIGREGAKTRADQGIHIHVILSGIGRGTKPPIARSGRYTLRRYNKSRGTAHQVKNRDGLTMKISMEKKSPQYWLPPHQFVTASTLYITNDITYVYVYVQACELSMQAISPVTLLTEVRSYGIACVLQMKCQGFVTRPAMGLKLVTARGV